MTQDEALKTSVRDFWNSASCGEDAYAQGETLDDKLEAQFEARFRLEPYIHEFARFGESRGTDVLEVGVGMGADHLEWARSRPRNLAGIDLTERAIDYTRKRLRVNGFESDLRVGDAERLPFDDASFDLVYSWGVLHHTPDTRRAFREVHRVLRPGGVARIMIYHTHSMVGYMLWLRYALAAGRPARSLANVYAEHLESPGTKAYTTSGARTLARDFARVTVRPQLSFGDLLEGAAGQRHRGPLLTTARRLYPREFVRRFLTKHGLYLFIEAWK